MQSTRQYSQAKDSNDRQVRTVLVTEGVANGLILLAKLSVGLSTGSTALLSDAVHSLTDIANNGIALVAARVRVSAHAPSTQ